MLVKRLLLIGGGHSHIEVLRRFALDAPPAEVLVVTPERYQIYSGMLPGHIAGHYRADDITVDVAALCERARAALTLARVSAIDFGRRTAACSNGQCLSFDVLSLDVGSAAARGDIPGVPRHVTPLRPLGAFVTAWHEMRNVCIRAASAQRIVIVGAGAGGCELALAMNRSLAACERPCEVMVLSDSGHILPDHNTGTRTRVERLFRERGIAVRVNHPVIGVDPGLVNVRGETPLRADHIVWATGPSAHTWIGESGLATDPGGFALVGEELQSVSHPGVFASGDTAAMQHHPRPKSGVYAVRQGPPLAVNLRRALLGQPFLAYRPQRTALALMSAGDRSAIGEYARLTFEGKWVWQWKNYIDRRFLRRYR